MNILFIAQHYAPEEVSGAVLATELATDLAQKGHAITFITAAPSYPENKVFPGYRNELISVSVNNAVHVIRVWSHISTNRSFWSRSANFITFSIFAFFGGLFAKFKLDRRPDVIFSYSPPLPLGLSAWLLSRLFNNPWILRVEDLFPDAAIAAGILRNPLAIRFFLALERFLYLKADHISVISEGFRNILLSKGVPASKISVESVWADPDAVRPMAKENSFRKEHSLSGKFVTLYSGNIGETSALDEVLSAAKMILNDPSFYFVIVGEGINKVRLMEKARQLQLSNLKFLPFQPRERFGKMLASADVTLVTLNSRSASYSLPCKTFTNMASARPILAIAPYDSELAMLIKAEGCGINVSPDDPQAIVTALKMLRGDEVRCEEMGHLGRSALLKRFSRKSCVNQYEDLIFSVTK